MSFMETPVAESECLSQHPIKIVPNQAAEIGAFNETQAPRGTADKVRLNIFTSRSAVAFSYR